MAGLALSGLASGVDTSTIVDQLMSIERQKATRITNRQVSVTAHQTAIKGVSDKLNTLKAAATALNDAATWKATATAASSDPAKVAVTLLAGAGIGGHTVAVERLASSAQKGFTFTPNAAAGTLKLTGPSGPATTINVAANATAKDIATAINASDTAPVFAAVITDADGTDRLVMSSRKSGQSNDFTVDSTGLAGGQLAADAAYERSGTLLNASYKLDGEVASRTSETNSIENAVPGLRITLKGVTSSPVTVSTSEAAVDKEGVKTQVKAFVDAYNAVVDLTRADTAEKRVVGASSTADLQKGQLFGDLGLDSMLSGLKNKLSSSLAGIGSLDSLSDIGITIPKSTGGLISDDAKAGKLSFDGDALDTQMDKDWTQVRSLFIGSGPRKGFSLVIADYVTAQTGTKGVLTGRMKSDGTSLTDMGRQLVDTNARLDLTEKRLKAKFAAMETALQTSQSQSAWLSGQINAMNK
jgi:flagellar hook-associated protein 2